jgi:hypothetical protein
MIVRLIDKKGFTKVVETDSMDRNRIICFPLPFRITKDVFSTDEIDQNEILKVLNFRYQGRHDFDYTPLFEEF